MLRIAAVAAALLISTQVHAQDSQSGANPTHGVTSGPAAGSSATMTSPQAGPLATKHQREVLRKHGRSVHDTGDPATGSSTPSYAPAPK